MRTVCDIYCTTVVQQIQGTPQNAHEEKSRMLADRISELVEQAERLGCEGKVDEAQGVLKLCDQLRDERMSLAEVCKLSFNLVSFWTV